MSPVGIQCSADREWWKEAVVYEIYPRSFNDSTGDGVGDLPGIVEKIGYLEDLGIDAVWLTPVYDSPLADYGYDVRDYRSILDEFGDMDDWEEVRDELHERGMKLVMDLVANHTSDEHQWFEKSRRGVAPYADYYIWRGGAPDDPPNNWESVFGGSAWTYDEVREAWYLHLFDEKQPDLDWTNPAMRTDMYEEIRWWLEKDVDGFRLDVINFLSKADGLPDGRSSRSPTGCEHFINGPRIVEYLREMDERVFSDYDIVTVGEAPGTSVTQGRAFVGEDGPLDMIFHFEHMDLDIGRGDRWSVRDWGLADLKETFTRWQYGLYPHGWNALYLNNHDQSRMVSRFGDETYRIESATMLATFLHTLRGTPFVYQGEEIGMTNGSFESVDELEDVETRRYLERMLARSDVEGFEDVADAVNAGSRDTARTPMQWSGAPNAGFTTGEPWIAVNADYPEINVEAARADPDSVWHYYRRLIELRHEHSILVYGRYELIDVSHPDVYAYLRIRETDRALVVLNFSDESSRFPLGGDVESGDLRLLLANYPVAEPGIADPLELRPYEARVYGPD